MNFQPVIKWSGSKRYQSEKIVQFFPKQINTYYEPFVGGASVLRQLLQSNIKVNHYICSDINKDLINLWNKIKNDPDNLISNYSKMWLDMNCTDDELKKKSYYMDVRARYNSIHLSEDFLFLSRTAVNGLIRYNSKGEFNSAFHFTRSGIIPETLSKIIFEWSEILNKNNVIFKCQDYKEIHSELGDCVYIDPPYQKSDQMYFGFINYKELWDWMDHQKGSYFLSFNGTRGNNDFTQDVPKEIYDEHVYLNSGSNSYKRLKKEKEAVTESLYIKKIGKDCREENLLINQKEDFQLCRKNISQTL